MNTMDSSLCSSYREVRNKKAEEDLLFDLLVVCCVSLRVEPLLLSAILISDSESKCTNTGNKPSAHFYPALFLSPHPRQASCWHCHIISVSFVPSHPALRFQSHPLFLTPCFTNKQKQLFPQLLRAGSGFFLFFVWVSHVFVTQLMVVGSDDSLMLERGTPTTLGIIDKDSTHATMATESWPA